MERECCGCGTLSKSKKVAIFVCWGNDDAESTLEVDEPIWNEICSGGTYEKRAWSYYEGARYRVVWRFENGMLNVVGLGKIDYMQCILDMPVDQLDVEVIDPRLDP